MINIVCFGDSITEGREFPLELRWTTLLQDKLDTLQPKKFQVHNCGISGNTTAQGIDRFAEDVMPLLPGILLIEFGFNDANVYHHNHIARVSQSEYERNLREFYRIAIQHQSVPVFVINHLIAEVDDIQGNQRSFNDNFQPYNDLIKTIADDLQSHVIDMPDKMRSKGIVVEEFVSADGIHLDSNANETYAEMIYTGIDQIVMNY
ncbi:MAG: SGNH/GDSL hydrolase family protein [Pseudomonadota bacterium]